MSGENSEYAITKVMLRGIPKYSINGSEILYNNINQRKIGVIK